MSAVKHTPVPWWATDHGIRDSGGYIAHMNSVQHYEGQDERYAFEVARREADKRLIAAAPELLDCLQQIHDSAPVCWWNLPIELQQAIKAALFKATGQQPDPTR